MFRNRLSEYELDLLQGLRQRKKRHLAKAITYVENNFLTSRPFMGELHQCIPPGKSDVIGITGPPGAGKSTLTGKLIQHYRQLGKEVGVILIDPTSPFSGGAILGDRIRMSESFTDTGVFIRSMGSRGRLGGLSAATQDAIKLMDAYGFDVILVETVGIGQAETEIVETADITVVVSVPGLGDDIQIIKAGIMEIGDLFVVNKADKEGAERVVTEINMMLDLAPKGSLRPPVIKTVSTKGTGIDLLAEALHRVKEQSMMSGKWKKNREERLWKELESNVSAQWGKILRESSLYANREMLLQLLSEGKTNAYSEAVSILNELRLPSDYGLKKRSFGMLQKIDHLGIAVKDLAQAVKFYHEVLGLELKGTEVVEEQMVTVAMLQIGESKIELLEPTSEESPIAKTIEKRGEGIAHVAFQVDNIEETLAQLKAGGARLIDETPRIGAGGAKIAFVHPKSTYGVLVELCEKH